MSTIEQNKAIYRRFIQEIFSEGRVERVNDFAHPDYVVREAPTGTPAGPDGIVHIVKMFRAGFPDLNLVIEELIGEGDWLAARATSHGTHQGTIFGVAPTGRKIAVTGLTMVRIVDGKLVESWVKNDVPALMAQLGVKPG